ncbi:MAG: P-II family nitrogen regulator [Nanoarchaeota archaeon]|nr:P-II family nitrogen regulator [Nanoarchaeota archaeon]MBU1005000.1 P-II family nitrogen regulator [Nanoarchaeota archaeon]MBU1945892.1 P-II family nitrogen regulator [Nanoarchaeota archaeon]
MKLIISIIRPEKLPDVKQSLLSDKIHMATVIDVRGCGQQKGYMEEYRGIVEEVNLHRKVMVIIAVNESYVDKTVKSIIKGARTNGGDVGDGKIFILDLFDCIRIRTGEKGVAAIGGPSEELDKLKKSGKIEQVVIK